MDDLGLLARLVGFDTTSHESNLPLVDFLCDYAERPGVRIDRNPSDDGNKANLVVRLGPDGDGRAGLVLAGHTDVVPALETQWQSDPFELLDGGDRFFGRGTCDMKGFLSVATNVALEARDLKAPLVLLLTYDEELGTLGARRFVETWPEPESLPKSAIIGEPTELKTVRMHKGHIRMRVTLLGRAAHSGYPHLGRNAIEAAGRILVSLRGLRHRLEAAGGPNTEFFPEVPFVPLNVGLIRGGVAVNVVPDRCELEIGARPLPGMNEQGVIGSIRDAVANAAGGDTYEFEVLGESPPMLLESGAAIHGALCGLVGQSDECAVSFATDAGWLSRVGMECAICGPGSIEVAHRPNEYVPKADLVEARRVLEQAVERFCK